MYLINIIVATQQTAYTGCGVAMTSDKNMLDWKISFLVRVTQLFCGNHCTDCGQSTLRVTHLRRHNKTIHSKIIMPSQSIKYYFRHIATQAS